jgi:predicted nucleic acid-binding protein
MTLYLDTSSLVKLYIEESGTDDVRQDLGEASAGATSVVAYVEARAAFARLRRQGTITPAVFRSVKRDFDADWSRYLVVEPTLELCWTAGELAERYRLRGFDSIHLATFLHVAREARPSEARFSSFDRQLNRAARTALRSVTRPYVRDGASNRR